MRQPKTEADVMDYLYSFVRPDRQSGHAEPPIHYARTLERGTLVPGFWQRWLKFCRAKRRKSRAK